MRTKHWVMAGWRSTGSQISRPLTTDHRPSWTLHNCPCKPGTATLFGGGAGKPLSAASLEGSMLKGLFCLCYHFPEMNRWWWSLSAAGISERRKNIKADWAIIQSRWWGGCGGIYEHKQPSFTKVHPFFWPFTLLLRKLTLVLHHKYGINKCRK